MPTARVHTSDPSPDGIAGTLRRARECVEPSLRRAVATLPDDGPDSLYRMAGYHLGWWDRDGLATDGHGGKALRPALAIIAAEAWSGDGESAVGAAAAVELVHNFTLLHDDIVDRDRVRRGRATVWAAWDLPHALLLGDALHALAYQTAAQWVPRLAVDAILARLTRTSIDLCRGELDDCVFESGADITVDHYLRMAVDKTGALLGCACAVGALSAGADQATVAALERFGRQLGLAFQFVDDLLGLWGDPGVTGKPVGSDLLRRKRSLPIVYALESTTAAGRELRRLLRDPVAVAAPGGVERATDLIIATGGRDYVELQVRRRVRAALAALPDTVAPDELIALTELLAHRDS